MFGYELMSKLQLLSVMVLREYLEGVASALFYDIFSVCQETSLSIFLVVFISACIAQNGAADFAQLIAENFSTPTSEVAPAGKVTIYPAMRMYHPRRAIPIIW